MYYCTLNVIGITLQKPYYKPHTRYKAHLKIQGIQQIISHIVLQIDHAVAMATGIVEVVDNYN